MNPFDDPHFDLFDIHIATALTPHELISTYSTPNSPVIADEEEYVVETPERDYIGVVTSPFPEDYNGSLIPSSQLSFDGIDEDLPRQPLLQVALQWLVDQNISYEVLLEGAYITGGDTIVWAQRYDGQTGELANNPDTLEEWNRLLGQS